MRRIGKYGAVPATSGFFPGVVFPSKAERDWAEYQHARQRDGEISGLRLHPSYVLSQKPSCKVTFDTYHVERGVEVVADVKGAVARDFNVRVAFFHHLYPSIRVLKVKRDPDYGWKITELVKGKRAA